MTAPWRAEIERLYSPDEPTTGFMQLATVSAEGRPANRTVVFRGFPPNSDVLTFVTDARSQKVSQISAYPCCEICWYFIEPRVQFRISGRVQIVDESERDETLQGQRQGAWAELSAATKEQFDWPEPRSPKAQHKDFEGLTADARRPPESFCLCLLHVDYVDRLDVSARPHRRTLFWRDDSGEWSSREVNP